MQKTNISLNYQLFFLTSKKREVPTQITKQQGKTRGHWIISRCEISGTTTLAVTAATARRSDALQLSQKSRDASCNFAFGFFFLFHFSLLQLSLRNFVRVTRTLEFFFSLPSRGVMICFSCFDYVFRAQRLHLMFASSRIFVKNLLNNFEWDLWKEQFNEFAEILVTNHEMIRCKAQKNAWWFFLIMRVTIKFQVYQSPCCLSFLLNLEQCQDLQVSHRAFLDFSVLVINFRLPLT